MIQATDNKKEAAGIKTSTAKKTRQNRSKSILLTFDHLPRNILIGIGIAFLILFINIGAGVFLLITDTVTPDQDISNATTIIEENQNYIILGIILIISSVIEEIVFRGILLQWIRKHKGTTIAVITTSILFGISHLFYGQLYTVIMATIMGVILALVVFKTKNLVTSITAHTTYNIILLSIAMMI